MGIATTEELVLAHLAGENSRGSLPELTDALSLSPERLSDRIDLVSALESLEEDGHVEVHAPEGAALTGDSVSVALTDAGRKRAREVRERVATAEVAVAGGPDGSVTVEQLAEDVDRPVVAVAADATDEGVYRTATTDRDSFLGREAEFETCRDRLDRAREGRGGALFLTGPAGVGKTALAQRVVEAAEDGFEVLRARCRTEAPPYQPLRAALSEHSATPFADVGPEVEDPEAFRAQQTALFSDVTGALTPAEGDPPRVLFLDDLHLADPATLAYLSYLRERLAESRLLLVGCYRPAELPEDAPTDPGESVTHVGLDPFDREDTAALIGRVLERGGVPDEFASAVHERTGGNPMFVETTVEALLDTDRLSPDLEWYPETPAEIATPEAVDETIHRQVEQFPAEARELLGWAAVFGERVDAEALAPVTDVPEPHLGTYLELFLDAAVFETVGEGAVQFRSEVVREALLDRIDDDERRRRHDAIATTLEERFEGESGDRSAAIATHHRHAGNVEDAVEWYLRAGERATDVYAHETAVEHLQNALALARDDDRRETVVEVAGRIAAVYETVGEYDQARKYAQFARDRAETDAERRAALVRLAAVATRQGDHERAIDLAETGLETGDDVADETGCRLLHHEATAQRELGQYDRARETGQRQRELAADLDDPSLLARALGNLGAIARGQGDYARARECFEEALERNREAGDRAGVGNSLNNLGVVAFRQGDYEAAREHYRESLEVRRDIGDRHGLARTLTNLGIVMWSIGEYDPAREHYEEALSLYRAVGDRHGVARTLTNLGAVAHKRENHDDASARYEESLSIYRELGASHGVGIGLVNLGLVARDRGEFADARDYLADGLEIFDELSASHNRAQALSHLGYVSHRLGEADAALEHLREGESVAAEVDDPALVAGCRLQRAAIAAEAGDHDDCDDLADDGLDAMAGAPTLATEGLDPIEAARRLVDAVADAGRPDRARELADRLVSTLDDAPEDYPDHREWFDDRRAELAG